MHPGSLFPRFLKPVLMLGIQNISPALFGLASMVAYVSKKINEWLLVEPIYLKFTDIIRVCYVTYVLLFYVNMLKPQKTSILTQ